MPAVRKSDAPILPEFFKGKKNVFGSETSPLDGDRSCNTQSYEDEDEREG
jgi:hypothetical protein